MQCSKEKRTFWSKHIKQWNKSGLTQASYCEQENLKPHQFFYWKVKFGAKSAAPTHEHLIAAINLHTQPTVF